MIKGDKIENYLFIRHQLFRITEVLPESAIGKELKKWNKSTFYLDFAKDDLKKVRVFAKPDELDEELRLLYIMYLEQRVYKWDKLIVS